MLPSLCSLVLLLEVVHAGVTLAPPPAPTPAVTAFDLVLDPNPTGLSITHDGSLFGFSIELSIVNQHLGKSADRVKPQFANFLDNIAQRGGSVHVRVGGNTQDHATLVNSLPDGAIIAKSSDDDSDSATNTPSVEFTPDLLKMMAVVQKSTNVKWYLGIPFNDTSNFRLQIVDQGMKILGDSLAGWQVGNEPDLYAGHQVRSPSYSPSDYVSDFSLLVKQLSAPVNHMLLGPSVSSQWSPEDVWDTGFISTFSSDLSGLTVERYFDTACTTVPHPRDAQTIFPNYLNHTAATSFVARYTNSTSIAVAAGKPFMNMETNTATCSGFDGLSNSFGAALWAADYALQMGYQNFSRAMFHIGGQDTFYNAFTAPVSSLQSSPWAVGPVYFAGLVVAETLGSSGKSQVLDVSPIAPARNSQVDSQAEHVPNAQPDVLASSSGMSEFTPAYVIYEDGVPQRLALFNFVTDQSGGSSYTATVKGVKTDHVVVKYMTAASVSQVGNFSWAGQDLGTGAFDSSGTLQGTQDIQNVVCDGGWCSVVVPAPGFALVFLTPEAQANASVSKASASAGPSSATGSASGAKETGATSGTSRVVERTLGLVVVFLSVALLAV